MDDCPVVFLAKGFVDWRVGGEDDVPDIVFPVDMTD